jgi:hypothetical protein
MSTDDPRPNLTASDKPELGFYHHYKHDPLKGVNEHAYRILGVSMHSEDRSFTVLYRPLYPAPYLKGADFMNRPLEMFLSDVTKDGKTFPRFQKITDPEVIAQLEMIERDMYGTNA